MTIRSPLRSPLRPPLRSVFDVGVGGGGSLAAQVIAALGASLVSMRYPTPDFAGLYQGAAGTTPVTEVGQPVGLMLDRRFGLARIAIGDVASATLAGDVTRDAQGIHLNGTGDVGVHYAEIFGLVMGRTYELLLNYTTATGSTDERPVLRGGIGNVVPDIGPSSRVFTSSQGFVRLTYHASLTTNATVTEFSIREIPGNHASQTTTTARPTLRSGPLRIDYDGVDDYLRTVFPALGSDVTIARSIPGVGAQILTGQTIAAGNWDDNVDSCATLVIDRALTGPETALVTAFLNQQAGV